jgi:hypothetical protein
LVESTKVDQNYDPAPFQLNEMDFTHDLVKKPDIEGKDDVDNISDVAKTFKHLRNQLVSQNRSRTKINLNKVRSQKNNENAMKIQSIQTKSRNIGEHKLNSVIPIATYDDPKMFERKIPHGSSPEQMDTSRLNSATTLYIDSVSNKNNEHSSRAEEMQSVQKIDKS